MAAALRHCIRARRLALLGLLLSSTMSAKVASLPAAEAAQFTAGQLLVATPEMRDPRFAEAVIYMVKHNTEGAMGLVINRPLAKGPVKDLLRGFGIADEDAKGEIIIHYGGPVNTNAGFVLHSDDVMLDDSESVNDGIAMTANAKLIEAIAHGKGPRQSLVVFGYAGWAPGQLEGELEAGAWHVVPADKTLVFGKEADKKWQQATDRRRISL
jgi:putative transcriptional regulator